MFERTVISCPHQPPTRCDKFWSLKAVLPLLAGIDIPRTFHPC